jgi:monofunctional biosynthetic peptidoglycan transglycosylase
MTLTGKYLLTWFLGMTAMSLGATEINFEDPQEINGWRIVNDGVMGGLSRSSVEIAEANLIFQGKVSLENNGGFASVRREGGSYPDRSSKIRIRFKADAKIYQLRLRSNQGWDEVSYSVKFSGEEGVWLEKSFVAEDFVASWRGKPVENAPRLKLEDVKQLGFLISDKQAGAFKLEVSEIDFVEP